MKKGSMAREIELTKRILDKLQGKVPVLATVFSPLYTARGLCGGSAHPEYIKGAIQYSPEDVHKGLEVFTETNFRFLDELIKLGIDGIFYADAFASLDDMDRKTHEEFSAKYDLQVLNYIKDKTWFNMLHVHGYKNLRFSEYEELKFPVHSYNWEDRFGDEDHKPISLKTVRAITDKVLMGGIDFWNDFNSAANDREAVKAVLKERLVDALAQLGPGDQKFIFTPGCSVKMHVPEYRMQLIHEVVEEVTGIA
jgi:uroporphyrinogen decarboxylase